MLPLRSGAPKSRTSRKPALNAFTNARNTPLKSFDSVSNKVGDSIGEPFQVFID